MSSLFDSQHYTLLWLFKGRWLAASLGSTLARHNLGMARPSGQSPAIRPAGRPSTRKQQPGHPATSTAIRPAGHPTTCKQPPATCRPSGHGHGHRASPPPRPHANYPTTPPGHGHTATATRPRPGHGHTRKKSILASGTVSVSSSRPTVQANVGFGNEKMYPGKVLLPHVPTRR